MQVLALLPSFFDTSTPSPSSPLAEPASSIPLVLSLIGVGKKQGRRFGLDSCCLSFFSILVQAVDYKEVPASPRLLGGAPGWLILIFSVMMCVSFLALFFSPSVGSALCLPSRLRRMISYVGRPSLFSRSTSSPA